MQDFSITRQNMINSQLKPNGVLNPLVLDALSKVPKETFVPEIYKNLAYLDESLEISTGRYLMESMVFGKLIQEIRFDPEDVVLDIGCGTGYSTAVFSKLVATVVGLEENQHLRDQAIKNLLHLNVDNVAVIDGSHNQGDSENGPYNVIFLGGAVEFIPNIIKNQLNDGGRLVAVLNKENVGRGIIVQRNNDTFTQRDLFDANIPILAGFSSDVGFVF